MNRLAVFTARRTGAVAPIVPTSVAALRELHFPLSKPPLPITYLDSDPLEYALRIEARCFQFDDMQYTRELAFVRIGDNPTVGDFRNMTGQQRREMFWGSNRQDFFRMFTWKVIGKPEHLYTEGW